MSSEISVEHIDFPLDFYHGFPLLMYLFISIYSGLMQFVTCQCQCTKSATWPGPVEFLGRAVLLLLEYWMVVRNLV